MYSEPECCTCPSRHEAAKDVKEDRMKSRENTAATEDQIREILDLFLPL
jgi:hypothetical protein